MTATDLEDVELQRIVDAAGPRGLVRGKAGGLYEQARRKLPPEMKSNGHVNPQMIPTPNLRGAMRGFEQQIANQISGQGTIRGRARAALIMNALFMREFYWLDDLAAIRTSLVTSLANFNPADRDARSGATENTYAAASRDMELGLIDISNRAWNRVRLEGNTPKRATVGSETLTPRSRLPAARSFTRRRHGPHGTVHAWLPVLRTLRMPPARSAAC